MDLDLLSEKIDPHVPFRPVRYYKHRNWAGSFRCFPDLFVQPQSIEELRKVVRIASQGRKRVCLTGCGHSPSDLTCTSQILVNIDALDRLLDLDKASGTVRIEAGVRLHDLDANLKQHGLAMKNLGSIDHQSLAGAISTSTHGSSLYHGLLSQSISALKIMLADGSVVSCSKDERLDLFQAALVSLGSLGIIIEATFQAISDFRIEWEQKLLPLHSILQDWNKTLWTEAEFTRVWWMPYCDQGIRWRASKTDKPRREPKGGILHPKISYHVYQLTLYLATWIPSILPTVERFVGKLHYGSKGEDTAITGVEDGHQGLLMDCLYSQFVNEWAIPLNRGPEAITRLSAWLNGKEGSNIPFDSKGVYVHAPVEVRISNTSNTTPRPFLDFTNPDGPTLFLNATLYRPYQRNPYAYERYYEAFEWLMKELGGRPHWAKNFSTVSKDDIQRMYEGRIDDWRRIRDEVDPQGMFVGDWHRKYILDDRPLPLEEENFKTSSGGGDALWYGRMRHEKSVGHADGSTDDHAPDSEKTKLLNDSS